MEAEALAPPIAPPARTAIFRIASNLQLVYGIGLLGKESSKGTGTEPFLTFSRTRDGGRGRALLWKPLNAPMHEALKLRSAGSGSPCALRPPE